MSLALVEDRYTMDFMMKLTTMFSHMTGHKIGGIIVSESEKTRRAIIHSDPMNINDTLRHFTFAVVKDLPVGENKKTFYIGNIKLYSNNELHFDFEWI